MAGPALPFSTPPAFKFVPPTASATPRDAGPPPALHALNSMGAAVPDDIDADIEPLTWEDGSPVPSSSAAPLASTDQTSARPSSHSLSSGTVPARRAASIPRDRNKE